METKTLFKVNQTVYDSALFGDLKGIVINDNYSEVYPIIVEFGEIEAYYMADGRGYADFLPTLSDQPYKVEYVPPQPQIELPEVGQWCWFWDDNCSYYVFSKFEDFNDNSDFPYKTSNAVGYKNCSTTNPIEK